MFSHFWSYQSHHLRGDDTQLYIFSTAIVNASIFANLKLLDLKSFWNASNLLSLSPSKTEFLLTVFLQTAFWIISTCPSCLFWHSIPSWCHLWVCLWLSKYPLAVNPLSLVLVMPNEFWAVSITTVQLILLPLLVVLGLRITTLDLS
jgi:hypothetical protein